MRAGEPAAAAAEGPWRFRVLLDGEPIGHHRFTLQDEGGVRTVRSEARCDVRLLEVALHRYATKRPSAGRTAALSN